MTSQVPWFKRPYHPKSGTSWKNSVFTELLGPVYWERMTRIRLYVHSQNVAYVLSPEIHLTLVIAVSTPSGFVLINPKHIL